MITPKIAVSQQNAIAGQISAQVIVGTLIALRGQTPLIPNMATCVRFDAENAIAFGVGYLGEVTSGDILLDINEVPPQNDGDVYLQLRFTSNHQANASIKVDFAGSTIENDIAPGLQLTLTFARNSPVKVTRG